MSTATPSPSRPLALAVTTDSVVTKAMLVVGGALLTAISAQIVIPMWPAPITAHTFAVLVVGAALGARLGGLSMVLYLAMGMAGLPVFAEASSGMAHLLGPTLGYLVAFPIAAWGVGRMAERRLDRSFATAGVVFTAGAVAILTIGAVGFMVTIDYSLTEALWAQRLYLPGELLKGAIATVALPAAWAGIDRAGPADMA